MDIKINPLQSLVADYWYKAMVVAGVFVLAISLVFEIKGVQNVTVQQLSFGIALIGIGEWINHPLQTRLFLPSVYIPRGGIATSYNRSPCLLGSLFDILGFIVVCIGFHGLFHN